MDRGITYKNIFPGYYIKKFTPMFITAKMPCKNGQFSKLIFQPQRIKNVKIIEKLCRL